MSLEALEEWNDALEAREAQAEHDAWNVQTQLDVVWIRLLRGENDLAVDLDAASYEAAVRARLAEKDGSGGRHGA